MNFKQKVGHEWRSKDDVVIINPGRMKTGWCESEKCHFIDDYRNFDFIFLGFGVFILWQLLKIHHQTLLPKFEERRNVFSTNIIPSSLPLSHNCFYESKRENHKSTFFKSHKSVCERTKLFLEFDFAFASPSCLLLHRLPLSSCDLFYFPLSIQSKQIFRNMWRLKSVKIELHFISFR